MFKKISCSLAVLLLITESQAFHINRIGQKQYVQFPDEYEDDEAIQTNESIQQSEQIHGKTFSVNDATVKNALVQNNKLNFGGDGQTFEKVFKIKNSMEGPRVAPAGVTFIQQQSDPIWGSLGPAKIAKQDLTPEQQFEQSQRNMKPAEMKDSEDVITTNNSIKIAEGIVKEKMADPSDKTEKARMANSAQRAVEYHLHGDDEEDEDTVETRKSVKTVEKRMKHRFFINAREKKEYEADVAAGKISAKELNFAEGDDEEIGAKKDDENAKVAKEADAKKKAGDEAAKEDEKAAKEKEGAKSDGEKKEEQKKEEKAEEEKKEGDAKKEEKKEEKKEGEAKKAEGPPPELAGLTEAKK